jgi:2-polyprenyl-3-methyl-5-hydroxy-6-metoxy-1,4-benzoquinol methylase
MDTSKMTTEMEDLKAKLRTTWMTGDFGEIARSYAAGAADFVNGLGILPGSRTIDVACGTGNQAIPAARLGADVTGIDIAPNLIEQARANAALDRLQISFDVGDAESMPYDDESFDVVLTMFGAMFAPRPERVAAELKRVCRPGGLIAMANWTPEGFIGQMFKLTGKYVTSPAAMPSPVLWGNEDIVRERFSGVSRLETVRKSVNFTFPFGPVETVEHFRKYYGPTNKAFASLDEENQSALRQDLEELWANANQAMDGGTLVNSEYLEVRAIRS